MKGYCDDIIRIHPGFIGEYPVLSLEYKNDGSRRSLDDIDAILQKADADGHAVIGGKEIPAAKLHVIYHRLVKNSRQLQAEKEKRGKIESAKT